MQTNDTLEQQNKELQFALSQFSHEIRNPLALISSELQMMASAHPEISSYTSYEHVLENLEYIKELLNELSTYNNARRLTLIPTDPAKYLHTVLASVKPTMDYLGVRLETSIPDSLPLLPMDQIKMRQALLNLLRNAREAISGAGGIISVTAESIPRGVRISIRDNGCGMDAAQLNNIFLPFVTYKKDGTGLGLAITNQIIQAHGGVLQAESTPEKGSVFHIFLG